MKIVRWNGYVTLQNWIKKNDIYVAIKDIVKFQENLEKSLCSTCYTCINSKIFRENVP